MVLCLLCSDDDDDDVTDDKFSKYRKNGFYFEIDCTALHGIFVAHMHLHSSFGLWSKLQSNALWKDRMPGFSTDSAKGNKIYGEIFILTLNLLKYRMS